ncbi:glycogen synthase GlgA [Neochlamydia sp. S13]|uniref:glycogen synthase GlgA n=1 Tax=Neochlamydia sp. S13 TaxID=1353976 RepID=UPI0005AB008D|nr:glycogen synthase GlgA [Neochlamydia sp. S13]BBI16506.1 glycogen synthase [Neochlamydia sp. S13]
MHIINIASELAPIAKVGGLGDVLLGLSRELSCKGHDIDLIIPKYDCMDTESIRDFAIYNDSLPSFYKGTWHRNTIWKGWVENLKVYFIEPHHPAHFFHRGCFYGCADDMERYLYFSRAALEFIEKEGLSPHIIHLHDWQTAVIAPLYHELYRPQCVKEAKIVFTIHNIEYQGHCSSSDLDNIGLNGSHYLLPDNMQDAQYKEAINLLKGAIIYADHITTVSPNYAKEVLTPLGGRGLDKTLYKYKNKFKGILNGIDYSFWNPEIDRYLPTHYSPREAPESKKDRHTLDKKAYIKNFLRERLFLAEEHRPIIGCIARLVPQKGIELIKHALHYTLEKKGQFLLLGSSPIEGINAEFQQLNRHFHEHPHVRLILHHSEELAHLIYAASDMFIVPSLFEPCGLTQMIALKYGTIPIVRKTGGLADTICDVDYSGKPIEKTNGYVFEYPDAKGIESALDRAFECWFHYPDRWRQLIIRAMKTDFSWNTPSDEYLNIYQSILATEKEAKKSPL